MAGVGQQRKAVREQAADHLHHHHEDGDRQGDQEVFLPSRGRLAHAERMIMPMVMVVIMVVSLSVAAALFMFFGHGCVTLR